MTVLHELWYCHVAVLSFHASSSSNPPRFPCAYPFLSDFRGQFWRSSGNSKWVMRHIFGKLSTSSFQRYKVCANRSSDEGVMAPGSRGVGAVFVHFSGEDSGQTGDAIGEPRVPRRSRSHYLSNAPGLADQLVASRKDSAREGGSCAAYFCKVPDLRKSELGLVRYGPANRGHRGVFDQLVASQEDSVRKRGNVGGKIPELSAKPYFVGLFSRAWPCTEASLGSQDMILANGGRRNVPYAKGSIPVSGLVNGPVKPWSNLVNLGQTWSNFGQSSPNSWRMYPGLHFKGFWAWWVPVGLETVRSNLGQTSVNPSQTWSTLVKLGQTLGNVSRTFFLGVFDVAKCCQISRPSGCLVLRADTRENPGGKNGVMTESPQIMPNRLTRGTTLSILGKGWLLSRGTH
uniref:Uncharacterized protein n=1 Tax=Fagus sylvatica TaxID=28930 RepID=A0A2N9FVC9_FAGSY